MSAHLPDDEPRAQAGWRFASTRWSVVVAAGQNNSPEALEALATLCRAYWYPLYAYARRHLPAADDAQDLTQAFFAQLLRGSGFSDSRRRAHAAIEVLPDGGNRGHPGGVTLVAGLAARAAVWDLGASRVESPRGRGRLSERQAGTE
jgi:hypothetical protein